MKIDAVLSISIGVCTVVLASACSCSLPRTTPPQQVPAATQLGGGSGDRPQTDVDDDMRKRGYKPTIYRGERVYCRNEALTGSNLESKVCLTAKQIEDQERSGKDILNGNRQAGCLPTKSGCN
ncbi:MAG: hypothetical protein ABSH33_21565 [Steroidobacteraceae bacterium]|jgi:hypothetical protein